MAVTCSFLRAKKTLPTTFSRDQTYEPSSHSGSTKLPPPLTAGIQDFFGWAAATIVNFLAPTEQLPIPVAPIPDKARLLFPPHKNEDPNPFRTAPEAAAISLSLSGPRSWFLYKNLWCPEVVFFPNGRYLLVPVALMLSWTMSGRGKEDLKKGFVWSHVG